MTDHHLNNRTLLLGDINAHHRLWEDSPPRNDPRGNQLATLLGSTTMSLVTFPNTPTYLSPAAGTTSTIDLTVKLHAPPGYNHRR